MTVGYLLQRLVNNPEDRAPSVVERCLRMRIATRCEDYQRYTHVVLDEAETAQTGDIHRVGFSLTAF